MPRYTPAYNLVAPDGAFQQTLSAWNECRTALLDDEQVIVLLALLGKDVLAVEQHVGTGRHVGVSEFLLVDAHATALGELAHLALAGEDGSHLGESARCSLPGIGLFPPGFSTQEL